MDGIFSSPADSTSRRTRYSVRLVRLKRQAEVFSLHLMVRLFHLLRLAMPSRCSGAVLARISRDTPCSAFGSSSLRTWLGLLADSSSTRRRRWPSSVRSASPRCGSELSSRSSSRNGVDRASALRVPDYARLGLRARRGLQSRLCCWYSCS